MYVNAKSDTKKKGFTLIELLIVIAIIGVLAATVVVSLGSQTEKAQQGSVKSAVSSLRTPATVAVVEGGYGANGICDEIYSQVSGETANWTWSKNPYRICKANDAGNDGEICCSSKNEKWVLWGKLSGNGADSGEVYCADSSGYLGAFILDNSTNERNNNTTVKKGKGVAGGTTATIESCTT